MLSAESGACPTKPWRRRVHQFTFGRACIVQGPLAVQADVSVQRGIEGVNPCEVRLDQFHRRDGLRADEVRHFGCAGKDGDGHGGQSI